MKTVVATAVAGIIGGGAIWWMVTGGAGVFEPSPAAGPQPVAPVIQIIPTSTPTQIPTTIPTSTSTPDPTNTPQPTSTTTQQATYTPIPTSTPTPTDTPLPAATHTPTVTVTPTMTFTPTATPPVCGHVELTLMGAGKKHDPCYTPTPTPDPSANNAPASTATAAAQATVPTPAPAVIPMPTIAAGAASSLSTPYATAAPEDANDPSLLHLEEKQYMLELINNERDQAGLNPVEMGDNIAAQLHSESALKNCFASHWGVDGLKPYMRYSLAGGHQANAENGHGSDYCVTHSDGYAAIDSVEEEIRQAMNGWMRSPGHRRNILDKFHKKVNIGLAWDRYNFLAYQHFEGDYVEYAELPSIENGRLSFSGTAKNGVRFSEKTDLSVQVYYDPPPRDLTRGQISRTYCYSLGVQVASLRPPVERGWRYRETAFPKTYSPCPDPYEVPHDAAGPNSVDEALEFWEEAYDASGTPEEETIFVPWITASGWTASDQTFSVTANLGDVLKEHRRGGVYTILVWGKIDGEDVVISEYSIFQGITPPNTYAR